MKRDMELVRKILQEAEALDYEEGDRPSDTGRKRVMRHTK